jgi:hypothetical protein
MLLASITILLSLSEQLFMIAAKMAINMAAKMAAKMVPNIHYYL